MPLSLHTLNFGGGHVHLGMARYGAAGRERLSFSRLGRRQLGCFTEDKLLSAIFMVHEESNLQSSPLLFPLREAEIRIGTMAGTTLNGRFYARRCNLGI